MQLSIDGLNYSCEATKYWLTYKITCACFIYLHANLAASKRKKNMIDVTKNGIYA